MWAVKIKINTKVKYRHQKWDSHGGSADTHLLLNVLKYRLDTPVAETQQRDDVTWGCHHPLLASQEHPLPEEHHPLEPDHRLHPAQRHLVHRPADHESRGSRKQRGTIGPNRCPTTTYLHSVGRVVLRLTHCHQIPKMRINLPLKIVANKCL